MNTTRKSTNNKSKKGRKGISSSAATAALFAGSLAFGFVVYLALIAL